MTRLKDFTISSARPLPVILLADLSGSMAADGKIEALNTAVAEMIAAFSEEEDGRAEIHLAVVTFGGQAEMHIDLASARDVKWAPMTASGSTPLGAGLEIVTDLIEDRERLSSRAYRPVVALVSDGQPNDSWRGPLARFHDSERAAKAQRFALGIGADADHGVLSEFLKDPEGRVFQAHEARDVRKFFRWVTMSVASRSRSAQPNQPVDLEPPDLDDYGDF